jgi:type I restriction enzyme M protein
MAKTSNSNTQDNGTFYHEWKRKNGNYHDIKGFCKSATLEDIEKHKFVLTPGRYVGIPDEVEDEVSFEDRMELLTAELSQQMRESEILDQEIKKQLAKVGFELFL